MAPKRRAQTAQRTPSVQQSRLSFQNKITKPASTQQAKTSKKDPTLLQDIVRTDLKAEKESDSERAAEVQPEKDALPDLLDADVGTVTTEEILGGRAQQSDAGAVDGEGSGWVGDEEERARKVTDTQIKRYWREKEQERKAPRVHQEDLTVYEKVLREWDMSGQYGVSTLSH